VAIIIRIRRTATQGGSFGVDEMILMGRGARNELIDLEKLSDEELQSLAKQPSAFAKSRAGWEKHATLTVPQRESLF